MKYICFGTMPRDYRIFDDMVMHSDVAKEVGREIISAGFIEIMPDGSPKACGYSLSLNTGADVAYDTAMLRLIWRG